jgi:hypothetical protein
LRLEDAMKVERRQARGTRNVREPQWLAEMPGHVIDREVDPFGVANCGCRPPFQRCSQDLASAACSDLYDGVNRPFSGDSLMQLGNFSVGLAVKDIGASRAFYEKLGFRQVAGDHRSARAQTA